MHDGTGRDGVQVMTIRALPQVTRAGMQGDLSGSFTCGDTSTQRFVRTRLVSGPTSDLDAEATVNMITGGLEQAGIERAR